MFAFAEDIKDNRAYREFKEEGRQEGIEEGKLLGKLEELDTQFADGLLSREVYQSRSEAIRATLEALNAKRDGSGD